MLTYVKGSLYLAGPLDGAPLSVVAIVPAVAGPFDVGTVVTREALESTPAAPKSKPTAPPQTQSPTSSPASR